MASSAELHAENNHLRQLVQRLNIELSGMQLRHPEEAAGAGKSRVDAADEKGLPPWVASPRYLSPLLVAYDTRIQELEQANGRNCEAIAELEHRAGSLVAENTALRADLQRELDKQLSTAAALREPSATAAAAKGTAGAVPAVAEEHMREQQEQLALLAKENRVLSDTLTVYEDDTARLRTEAKERDGQLVALARNFQQAALALRRLKQANGALTQERSAQLIQLRQLAGDLSGAGAQRDEADQARQHCSTPSD